MEEMPKNRNPSRSRFLLGALVIFGLSTNGNAQDEAGLPGAVLRMGVGSRALSLGGAFVALADDPSALYWNPAGLSRLRTYRFQFMNATMPFDQTMNFVAGVIPVGQSWTIGVGWIGLDIDGIEARAGNTEQPDFVFGSNQNAFIVSAGTALNRWIALGGGIKVINNSLAVSSASGFGFDVSVLARPVNRLRIGLTLQDVGTDYRWENGFTEGVPMLLRLGTAIQLLSELSVQADYNKIAGVSSGMNLGAELTVAESFPVRLGLRGTQFAAGFGVHVPVSEHVLDVAYSYANDQLFDTAVHRISVGISFNTNRGRPPVPEIRIEQSLPPSEPVTPAAVQVEEKPEKERPEQPGAWVVVQATRLNVRSGPGINFDRITQVKRGDKLRAFERRGAWQKIELRESIAGWVHLDYVERIKDQKLD